MEPRPRNDRIAKHLEEIRAQEAALDREDAEREAAEREAAAADAGPVVQNRRKESGLRNAAFLIGVLLLAAGLFGLAVTLSRLAGDDIADADRLGQARATSCERHGPITNMGFGYWDRCTATITWDDGDTDREIVEAVLTSADIGTDVRVGDLGRHRTDQQLARADASPRPWLAWIGYAIGIIAFVPTLVAVLILRELLRFRRK